VHVSLKCFNRLTQNYPTYDQELLGVVCAVKEWRCYVEGSAKITIITEHAILCHLPMQESLGGRRHAIWLNDLSPCLAITPRTNEPIMEILNRKGPSSEADALSRRPELHHTIATAEHKLVTKTSKTCMLFLSSMSHLQENDAIIIHKIRYGHALDTTYSNSTLPWRLL
jgi:hypothetical protein